MPITHKRTIIYNDEAGQVVNKAESILGDSSRNLDCTVAIAASNHQIDWSITRAKLQAVMIVCDQALTLKTNSTGSPQDTIVLVAGIPVTWTLTGDLIGKCPFAGDVTTIYATNASGVLANLDIRAVANLA